MIGIIENQTKWYAQKAKALSKVTKEIMLLNPDRAYLVYKRQIKAIDLVINITTSANNLAWAFNYGRENHFLRSQLNLLEKRKEYLVEKYNKCKQPFLETGGFTGN